MSNIVLYSIPKEKLIVRVNSHHVLYFIPELNKHTNSKRIKNELLKLGMTMQDWYDRWILNITIPSDRPRCMHENCNKEGVFRGLMVGYRNYCSRSCSASGPSASFRTNNPSHNQDVLIKSAKNREWFFELGGVFGSKIRDGTFKSNYYKCRSEVSTSITGNTMVTRSGYERRVMKILDNMIQLNIIVDYHGEGDSFKYTTENGSTRNYFPDFKLTHTDGSISYLEIKGVMDYNDHYKWSAMIEQGLKFEVWFESKIKLEEYKLNNILNYEHRRE